MRRSGRLTVWHVGTAVPWVAVVIAARQPIADNSFLWHVRAGSLQLDYGAVLTADPFSAAFNGAAWRTQSWLADLLYGWLERGSGLGFSWWLTALAGVIALSVTMISVQRTSRSVPATAIIGVLTGMLSVVFMSPRPVVFSYALFALVILADTDRRLRWTLPLLMWVWVGVHGSFVLGGVYLLLQAVRRRDCRFVREIPVLIAVSLASAHGWGVVEYLLAFFRSRAALDRISEWATPSLVSASLWPLLAAVVVIVLASATRRELEGRDFIVAVPFLVFGLTSIRAVFPSMLALAPMLAIALRDWRPRLARKPLRGAALVLAAIGFLPFLLPADLGVDRQRFPLRLIDQVEGATVFHDDVVGGYLIYSRWPEVEVMIDDRAELYGDYLIDYTDARGGRPGWEIFLDTYGADQALVRVTDAIHQLMLLDGWQAVDAEGDYVLLRRSSA